MSISQSVSDVNEPRGDILIGTAVIAVAASLPVVTAFTESAPTDGCAVHSNTLTPRGEFQIHDKDWGKGQPVASMHDWPLTSGAFVEGTRSFTFESLLHKRLLCTRQF